MDSRDASDSPAPAEDAFDQDVRALLIAGSLTGSGADAELTLGPVYVITAYPLPWPPGDDAIVVWDGDAKVTEFPLTLDETIAVWVPIGDANYTRIDVLRGGTVIKTLEASAHVPTVDNLSATREANGDYVVSWNAVDLDGDPLTAVVQVAYRDDPPDWDTVAEGVTGNTVTIPAGWVMEGAGEIWRVFVSDGVLSAKAQLGDF